ncbi:hypothetical protein [Brevibacillus daliensis]|uniref:hypothetical protein n=1 Tax=Brevibacillus daliensis TaxID=2892995 RepID=UPI001E381D39|nr:hypothetical protein [Brevibacillus daliensis]
MEAHLARFYELKQRQKEVTDELEEVRRILLAIYPEPVVKEEGKYKIKVTRQEKREFDDKLLYEALPDPELWRLMSRADTSKINSLLKLGVISEQILANTFEKKTIPVIQISKK